MRRLRIGLVVGGVLVVLLLVVPFLIPVGRFRPMLEQRASAALGRQVSIGQLRLSLLHQSLLADALVIADDPAFGTSPFLTAKSVTVGVKLFPLITSRSLNVTDIRIEQPVVTLVRNTAGRWNYSTLATSTTTSAGLPGAFAIGKLGLSNGRVVVRSGRQQRTYESVSLTAADVSSRSRWPIVVNAAQRGGGTFTLAGDVGPIDQADASLTPLDAMVGINGLNLAKTGFLNPSAGGLLDLKATITSQGGVAEVNGNAALTKALLVAGGSPAAQPVVVSFSSKYDLRSHTGTLNPSSLKMGGVAARLAGTYDERGDATVVDVKVAGGRMPATELESFLPALGIHLPQGAHLSSGTIEANLNVAGAVGRLVATGEVGLFKATLTGFDLGSKMRVIAAFTSLHTGNDLDIDQITTNIRVAADGLRFDHFNGDIASLGHIAGAGTIDARNNLNFGMVATVAGVGLPGPLGTAGGAAIGTAIGTVGGGAVGGLLGAFTGGHLPTGRAPAETSHASNQQRIPFLVKGTTTNPQIVPDLSGVAMHMLGGQLGTLIAPR